MKTIKIEIEIGEHLASTINCMTFDHSKQAIIMEILERFDKKLLKIIKKAK